MRTTSRLVLPDALAPPAPSALLSGAFLLGLAARLRRWRRAPTESG